jgi:hypothetical protein
MKTVTIAALIMLVAPWPLNVAEAQSPRARTLTRTALEDKVRGGWAGQMLGVSFGAPTEFRHLGTRIEGELPAWTPGRVENAIDQDDLYVEMTFAAVMDRKGLDATSADYGEAFRQSAYNLWHANAAARRLLARGLKPPQTGDPAHNLHADDIDFQIEADFIGLMTPGLPREANRYCDRVGRVMNSGDGLYGGMFVAAMYSAAFFETDPRKVVEAGLAAIPSASGYGRLVRDVLYWAAQYPNDWVKAWTLVEEKWDRDDICVDGALAPFNIDAKINGAYIALGLLYGKSDFSRTIEIATRAGQDSDCNPSNAAGILGTMLGYSRIPDNWTRGIPALADRTFAFTDYSLNDIVRSTVTRALKVVQGAGGTVSENGITVPVQAAVPPPLDRAIADVPVALVPVTDAAWSREGAWERLTAKDGASKTLAYRTSTAGAVTTFRFSGTGIAIVGPMSQDGGLADVMLDGRPAGELDAYIVERTHDNTLWHVMGLPAGPHVVRVAAKGSANPASKGHAISIERAVVYGPRR